MLIMIVLAVAVRDEICRDRAAARLVRRLALRLDDQRRVADRAGAPGQTRSATTSRGGERAARAATAAPTAAPASAAHAATSGTS